VGEWKKYKLGEIAEIFDGPHATPEKTTEGEIFLGISNINNGKIDTSELEYLSKEDYKRWTRRVEPRENDVLFSYETKLGEAAIVPKGFRCCLGRRMGLLRSKLDYVEPKFLFYYYLGKEFQTVIKERTVFGTTVDRIPLIDMPQFSVYLPPLPEQRAIASVLSSLDDKIDLLRRENKTLETMAETLFRKWFVQEPDEKWEEKPLSAIACFLNGIACQNYPPTNEADRLPVLKIKELSTGITESSDWATSNIDQSYIVKNGDVIFSWSASLIVKVWDGDECVLNQHLFKVTSKEYPKWFYLSWCRYHLNEFIAISATHATTMGHIKRGDLDNAKVLVPSQIELAMMSQILNPLLDRRIVNSKQILILKEYRDTLLPKLMSGEVRVEA